MKTLTKLALALVLAVGVLATFSPEASAKGHHGGSHHGHDNKHHHGHHHHGHHHHHKHHSHKHHSHKHHSHHGHKHHHSFYGFGGYVPSKSFRAIYIPVELSFLGVR